jgi:hypothetical protein
VKEESGGNFDKAFRTSIELIDAEERLLATVNEDERKILEQTIQKLNREITPAAKEAAVAVHRFVTVAAREWMAEHGRMNVQRFTKHLNECGGALRKYDNEIAARERRRAATEGREVREARKEALKEGAIRVVLRRLGYVGKRGRPGRPRHDEQ